MSDNRRSRTNLLNNDGLRTTSALTGILSVLGKGPMGATCGGPRDTAAEELRDRQGEHAQAECRCGRTDVEPFRLAGRRDGDDPAGGRSFQGEGHSDDVLQPAARKGQYRDHRHEHESADGQPVRRSRREVWRGREGIRICRERVAREASRAGPGGGRE